MSADRLMAALKRKYRTPADALRRLGIDAALLDQEKSMPAQNQPTDFDTCIAFIKTLLVSLPPNEAGRLLKAVREMDTGTPEMAIGAAEDRKRAAHYAVDSKPYRPRRPITTAAQRAFDARFPSAARIGAA